VKTILAVLKRSHSLEPSKESRRGDQRKVRPLLESGWQFGFPQALAFLMGRLILAGSFAPFGPAFYGAYRSLGGYLSPLCGLFVMLGSATLGRWDILLYHAVSVALLTLIIKPKMERGHSFLLDVLIPGLVIFLTRGALALLGRPTLFAYLSAFIEGLCGLVAGVVFQLALARDKVPRSWKEGRSHSLLFMLTLALGGLHDLSILGVNLDELLAMAGTLVLGYVGGPDLGAIFGLMAGVIMSLTKSGGPLVIGYLGVSGVLTGIGGYFGRLEALLGFLSGGLTMSFYQHSSAAIGQSLIEQIIVLPLVFFLTPEVKESLSRKFFNRPGAESPSERVKEVSEGLRIKVAAVSHAFSEMSALFSQASVSESDAKRGGSSQESGGDQTSALLKRIAERICRDCQDRNACWEEEFGATYESFSGLIRKIQIAGWVSQKDSSGLYDRCARLGEIVSEINHQKEIERLEARTVSMDRETKECLGFQYRCLGEMLAKALSPKDDEKERDSFGKSKFKVMLKGKTIPAGGDGKPGDVWAKYDIAPGKTLVVLVDGMGKGELAAKQSQDTIGILKSLLDSGLNYESCISFLNSALYLAWRPDGFVALDFLFIDHETERAYFYKLGSPPSFIRKKDGNVLVVRGSTPPAGAVKSVVSFASSEPLAPGDLVLLVSDGVFRSSPIPARAEHMVTSRLSRLKDASLDGCVKAILSQGSRYRGQKPPDDVTVVGAQIYN